MVGKLTPLNQKLIRDLWHIRGQVVAIAFVIGCGVATAVLALGTLHSLEETRDAYYERYHFGDIFAHMKRAPLSLLDDMADIEGVARVEGRITHGVVLDIMGMSEPARAQVISLPRNSALALNGLEIQSGRLPEPDQSDEVVLHEAFADANGFKAGDEFWANMNERRRKLRIVGTALSPEHIYVLGPGDIVPDNRLYGVFWMSEKALAAAYNLRGAVNDIVLTLTSVRHEKSVIMEVDRLIAQYGGIGAIGREDQLSYAFLKSEMDQQETMANVLPPIFLAVAAFLLNLVITRLIDTEREQIGLLKAFGYRDYEVAIHYLKFVAAIVMIGVVLGWLLGAWLGRGMTELYADFFRFPFLYYIIEPSVFAISASFSVAAASLGTFVAVRRAASLAPAVAMTPPPPTTYKANILERIGLAYALSQPARMILRHIVRWPLRSALTVIGISFAGALLVMTLFFLDALDEMTEVFFFEGERQDITIVLAEVHPERSVIEATYLPAVLRAEGIRHAPARLRFRARSERTVITGIDPSDQLKKLIDIDRRPVDVPPKGLTLTSKLAEMLNANLGDKVRIEILDGRRPTVDMPVVKIIKQYVGMAAYMNRTALNELLNEGPIVSSIQLQIDSSQEADLFFALKEMPSLLGLMIKRTSLESFYATIRQNIDTMITAYIAFASVIAVGVIYNAARISLSERARELASLRVLGFTKGEVAFILAGELAILTWAALPLSAFFGYQLSSFMVDLFDTELYRLPFVINPATYGYASLVIIVAATASAWIVIRRIANLDLIAVLKTRE